MGLLKLLDFRDELDVTFGERNVDPIHYNRWINYAYFDLCTSVDFDVLDDELDITTVALTRSYDDPAGDYIIIKHVRDETNDYALTWLPKEDFFRLTAADNGEPKRWTLHKEKLWFYPNPDGAYSLLAIFKELPDALAEDGDPTVLHAGWDAAVSMLASHYGYMAMGEEARGIAWFNRAIAYIQSRMTDEGLQKNVPGLLPSFNVGGNDGLPNA